MDFNTNEDKKRRRRFLADKSMQVFIVSAIILMTLVITVLCIGFLIRYEVETDIWKVDSVGYWKENLAAEQKVWYEDGIEELKEALKVSWELEEAKNVVILLMHGIGEEALAAVRFNERNEELQKMAWERFSHVGQILTNCTQTQACDAFSFGTALFGGVQTTQGIGGLDSAVDPQNCTQSLDERHHVKSILEMAQESNFRTGFVTMNRVSGPFMAALYAHSPYTNWECDTAELAGKQLQGCKDIATQLIDDEVGTKINVIMGGGRQTLVSSTPVSKSDPIDSTVCKSQDGRSYMRDWRTLKRLNQQRNAVLQNASELRKLNGSSVDFVLGIFANGNIKPAWLRNTADNYMPELSNMVEKALEVLKRKNDRFLLVVESGNGVHMNLDEQIKELKHLNVTLDKAMKSVSAETLFVALFENGSTTFNGTKTNSWPALSRIDGISENIKILAGGLSSYLFHGLHEDTYLAHAIAFALKIGPFQKPA